MPGLVNTRGFSRSLHLFKLYSRHKEYIARKLIGYSNEQMYEVVADIKNYKEFLPFCKKSTILKEEKNEVHANLEIGFPPVVENYTSKVTLIKPNLVNAVCTDGRLFSYLETTWKFYPGLESNPLTSVVDFYVKFEFKSILHSQLANMFFDHVVKQMEGAFIDEVKRRYGKESICSHNLSTGPLKNT